MKTLVRNFSHTFRRFFTASILNILGLSIAFASFFVIMTQVDYDYNFNKGYKDYEKIFRIEINHNPKLGWQLWMPRPLCELIQTCSPHVKSVSIINAFPPQNDYEVNGNIFNETTCYGFGNFLETFQPEIINGSADALNQPKTILISESMAKRFSERQMRSGKAFSKINNPTTMHGLSEESTKISRRTHKSETGS